MKAAIVPQPESLPVLNPHDEAIAHEIFEYWKRHGRAIDWHVAARRIVRHLRSQGHLKEGTNDNG